MLTAIVAIIAAKREKVKKNASKCAKNAPESGENGAFSFSLRSAVPGAISRCCGF